MKTRFLISLTAVLFVFSAVQIRAQESSSNQLVRPRVVAQNPVNPPVNQKLPVGVNPNVPLPGGAPAASTAPAETQKPTTITTAPLTFLTPSLIQSRISEARRMLKTRPMTTALSTPSIEFVTIAALDRENARTHLITLSKESFLTKGAQVNAISSLVTNATVNVLRANGVNTALTI